MKRHPRPARDAAATASTDIQGALGAVVAVPGAPEQNSMTAGTSRLVHGDWYLGDWKSYVVAHGRNRVAGGSIWLSPVRTS